MRSSWLENNMAALVALALLIPVFGFTVTREDADRVERMSEQIAVVVPRGEAATGDGVGWRKAELADPADAIGSDGEPIPLPEHTRLVVLEVDHRGDPMICDIRLRDEAGRTWNGTAIRLPGLALDQPDMCPIEESSGNSRWVRLALPFVVPDDAVGITAEVSLSASGEPQRAWARLQLD